MQRSTVAPGPANAAGPAAQRDLTRQWLSAMISDIFSQPAAMVKAVRKVLVASSSRDPSIVTELVNNGSLQQLLQQLPARLQRGEDPLYRRDMYCELIGAVVQTDAGCQAMIDGGHLATVLAAIPGDLPDVSAAAAGILMCLATTAQGATVLLQQRMPLVENALAVSDVKDRFTDMLRQLLKHPSAVEVLLQNRWRLETACTCNRTAEVLLPSLLAHEVAVRQFVQLEGTLFDCSWLFKSLFQHLKERPEGERWGSRRRARKRKDLAARCLRLVLKHAAGRAAVATQEHLQQRLDARLLCPSDREYAMAVLNDLTQTEECRQAMQQHLRGKLATKVSRLQRQRNCSKDIILQCKHLPLSIEGDSVQQEQQQQLETSKKRKYRLGEEDNEDEC